MYAVTHTAAVVRHEVQKHSEEQGFCGRGTARVLARRVTEYFTLPRDQRNEVLGAVLDAGLSPSDFRWVTTRTAATQIGAGGERVEVDTLMHEPTGYMFAFDVNLNRRASPHLYAGMDPGRNGPRELINAGDWRSIMSLVRTWAERIKTIHEEPDLWAIFAEGSAGLALPPPRDSFQDYNTPFTTEEVTQIDVGLDEVLALALSQSELLSEQVEELTAAVAELKEAARRVGRRDWGQIFLGAIFDLGLRYVLSSNTIKLVLPAAAHFFGHLLGGGGTPTVPGIGPGSV